MSRKPTGPTNPELRETIKQLRKSKKYIKLSGVLWSPRRKRRSFNVSDIEKTTKNEKKIATTEVLGGGEITKPIWVYAWRFSKSAKEKIEKAGGKCFSLKKLPNERDDVKVIV